MRLEMRPTPIRNYRRLRTNFELELWQSFLSWAGESVALFNIYEQTVTGNQIQAVFSA